MPQTSKNELFAQYYSSMLESNFKKKKIQVRPFKNRQFVISKIKLKIEFKWAHDYNTILNRHFVTIFLLSMHDRLLNRPHCKTKGPNERWNGVSPGKIKFSFFHLCEVSHTPSCENILGAIIKSSKSLFLVCESWTTWFSLNLCIFYAPICCRFWSYGV